MRAVRVCGYGLLPWCLSLPSPARVTTEPGVRLCSKRPDGQRGVAEAAPAPAETKDRTFRPPGRAGRPAAPLRVLFQFLPGAPFGGPSQTMWCSSLVLLGTAPSRAIAQMHVAARGPEGG